MHHEVLAQLRDVLGADAVTLVQPVVRDGALLVGQCQTVYREGTEDSPHIGRPLGGVARIAHPEELFERYHQSEGGVVGVPVSGHPYKCGDGMQPLHEPHLLGWTAPDSQPSLGCWLVLDGAALAFVHAVGGTLGDGAEALAVLGDLRRRLARAFQTGTAPLSGTGFVLLGPARTPEATDRRAAAFAAERGDEPWHTGVSAGTLVVARTLEGPQDTRLATVRPVRPPEAPAGLSLTPTQRAIARMLSSSATLDEIAVDRACSPATIRRHRDDIYRALGVSRRTELMERLRRV
ncbi:MAG: helix-turn-helix transcriptional regulator [Alphaproteobacteria bacterium]|nr:helix-turn-helix transcriptional regulator [Alphaproteobacteria bacterium]